MMNAEQITMYSEPEPYSLFSIHNSSFMIRPFFTFLFLCELLQ